jgi:hypothetical protein
MLQSPTGIKTKHSGSVLCKTNCQGDKTMVAISGEIYYRLTEIFYIIVI